MNDAAIKELLDKYLTETLTAEEMSQFRQLLEDEEQMQVLDSRLRELFDFQLQQEYSLPEIDQRLEQHVMSVIHNELPKPLYRRMPVRRWMAASAVVLLLILAGGGYYLSRRPVQTQHVKVLADIQPGRSGAMLTLADGTVIQLDSLRNGTVALQGGQGVQVQNGELVYNGEGNEVVYNTVSTPNGRQYRLVLPDGTKVWLNAGSSIHYPLLFRGKTRSVEMTGEAYFEVATDAAMPFVVTVNKKELIEVLGTSFNIKAYNEEKSIAATLLEGRIRVAKKTVLQPGQQALLRDGMMVMNHPELEKVIAWKNNLFDFDDSDLDEVMHQIARWYDIEVVYAGHQPNIQFTGKISRNMTLKNLLNTLAVSGVKCQLEDGKLIVFP
ncbi:FecR family protein [Chitinophaga pinensis]|uniref:Anti-FecI sigma factor, FecR n=1 Tax=Chitinophaga pinensis (strain ATCC 43595 / DSM 2588 / LMG 13176 / NBRC 15968 / NCIMB 11800 / UQM 2034) TaxID=485918 RepID=A0A979GNI0_CHIPD|nr:FecR family protein [Chitinophaga pinensis]ACU59572.1 anti-FecI sigma factor, FecR [Chitinophaga pinensis DSM 2588]